MIKHHPNSELLSAHVNGHLPASLSAAIAMHNELCPVCTHKVNNMTDEQAELSFEQTAHQSIEKDIGLDTIDIEQMIEAITCDDSITRNAEDVPITITLKDQNYKLPRAIQHMPMGKWHSFGKLTRARIELDEGNIHSS